MGADFVFNIVFSVLLFFLLLPVASLVFRP